jgi:hypothetical protein
LTASVVLSSQVWLNYQAPTRSMLTCIAVEARRTEVTFGIPNSWCGITTTATVESCNF